MAEVRWPKSEGCQAGGRNGYAACTGLTIWDYKDKVMIEPLKVDDCVVSGARIEIPRDKLLDVVFALWELYKS